MCLLTTIPCLLGCLLPVTICWIHQQWIRRLKKTMSSSKEEGVTKRKRQKEYNKVLKAVESQLAVWQKTYEAEQQKHLESTERNLILSEFLYTQDRLQSVLTKQQAWLAAGGLHVQQQQPQQHQQQHNTQQLLQMRLCDDTHWVIFLLETATWEHVQQALSMSSDDWTAYQRQYFSDLTELLEISKRCPEVQSAMLRGVASALQPLLEGFPAVYAATSSDSMSVSTGAAANSNSSGGTLAQDSPAAFDVIVHLLRTTGSLAYVALLHGSPGIFEAAARNVLTGEQTEAPPLHWVSVAQRMRFSREQKLHFKLALQNFARQAKAAAAQGLTILREAPSYAFLLACEAIAARQLSGSDTSGSAPLEESAADANPAAPAAAGADGGLNDAAQSWGDACRPGSRGRSVSGGPGQFKSPAWVACKQQRAAAGPTSASAAAAVAAGGGQNSHVQHIGNSSRSMRQDMQGTGAACDQQNGIGNEHEPMQMDGPAEELQRQFALYYRTVVNLNIFLADTLTLEQALMLNVASYPFWPMLSAVAEAAIQLPDEDTSPENDAQQQGVQLLMSQRRSFMQEAHHQWFSQDG